MTINTRIIEIDSKNIDKELIEAVADVLKGGGIAAIPTETVYGLGASIYHEEAVKNIFKAKGRPADNPLIVHISDKSMIDEVAECMTENAEILADKFMPGPITLVMKKKKGISDIITAGLDTVAIRFPEHPIARAVIEAAGEPVAAPSANISGKPSPTKAKHVIDDLTGRVDVIVSGGSCSAGVESTVVDVSGDVPVILRPGVVTYEDIKAVIPTVIIDKHVLKRVEINEVPKSPGMKYKHYSPEAEVIVVEGEKDAVRKKITELFEKSKGMKTGIISFLNNDYECENVLYAGSDYREYAHNLFSMLRKFDETGVKRVFAEFCEEGGCGLAVENRLYKSAGYNVIHV